MFTKRTTITKNKPKSTPTPRTLMVRKQVLVGALLMVCIAILGTAVWYITRLPVLQIQSVSVVGGFTIPHSEVENVSKEELAGTYLHLIPKKFALLYPERKILQRILDIPRVKNVRLEIDDNNTLVIVFDEYQPEGLWCKAVEDTSCLFVDATGFAFAEAPDLTGGAFIRYVNGQEPKLKTNVTDADFLRMTRTFSNMLGTELTLFVTVVEVLGDYDIEYSVAGGGKIKVSQTMSAEESFNNLKTVLTSPEFVDLEPGMFNYIDLRFGDKVFVSEVQDEEATSTATSTAIE